MPVSTRFHHAPTKSQSVRHVLKIQDIVTRIAVLASASDIVWWVTEYRVHGVKQKLPTFRVVLVQKPSEIYIVG